MKKGNMALLKAALDSPRCIISVMGDHAGEGVKAIFMRKIADIERTGKTFWLMKSPKAQPVQVHEICKPSPAYTIFIEPASKGGARPTTTDDAAREYSNDRKIWNRFPEYLSPVTGKLDSRAAALIFDEMATVGKGTIDLWAYADSSAPHKPLKFILGCSTICAVRKDMTSNPARMKSRYRGVVAVARLAEPYCAWLR